MKDSDILMSRKISRYTGQILHVHALLILGLFLSRSDIAVTCLIPNHERVIQVV